MGPDLLGVALLGLAQALLPSLCPGCRRYSPAAESPFCFRCGRGLEPLRRPFCSSCGVPFAGEGPSHSCPRCRAHTPPFRELRAWGLYRGTLQESIHRLKYRGDLAHRGALERLAAEARRRHFGECEFSAVVPVPCLPGTLRRRGFDLPALLARRLARDVGAPWRPRGLEKVRATPDLVGLGAEERARAVKGAYRPREAMGGEVLLVDDVATSTATARACAAACRDAGAEGVWVLVVARTPLEGARG